VQKTKRTGWERKEDQGYDNKKRGEIRKDGDGRKE